MNGETASPLEPEESRFSECHAQFITSCGELYEMASVYSDAPNRDMESVILAQATETLSAFSALAKTIITEDKEKYTFREKRDNIVLFLQEIEINRANAFNSAADMQIISPVDFKTFDQEYGEDFEDTYSDDQIDVNKYYSQEIDKFITNMVADISCLFNVINPDENRPEILVTQIEQVLFIKFDPRVQAVPEPQKNRFKGELVRRATEIGVIATGVALGIILARRTEK